MESNYRDGNYRDGPAGHKNETHNYKNNKTFSIKMKEDVGTSKPKMYVNKVGRLT